MNPRYAYASYSNPCRMPFSGTNYIPWPAYADPGVQLFYMPPQYTRFPMIQYDPLLYAPSLPHVWRPPVPTYPQQVYPQMLGQPLLHAAAQQHHQQAAHHYSYESQRPSNIGKPSDVTDRQTNQAVGNDAQTKLSLAENKTRSYTKGAIGEMPVIRGPRSSMTMYRQKRKLRRKRKKHLHKDSRQVASGDLSSINMDGTQDRHESELQAIENDDADYETCDEDDTCTTGFTGLQAAAKNNQNAPARIRRGIFRNSTEFTPISNDKSYSRVAFNRDHVSVKDTAGIGKRTFIKKTTKKNLLLNRKSSNCGSQAREVVAKDANCVAAKNYWADLSNVESFWNATGESINLCLPYGQCCRCKDCAEESLAEKSRNRSNSVARLACQNPVSPELWWDRSAGMGWWSVADVNDNQIDANSQKIQIAGHSGEFVVVDLHHERNKEVSDSGKNCTLQVDNERSDADSIILRKRRLLPVDWDSISECRKNLEACEVRNFAADNEDKIPSIGELDGAIVEHGPLTTEPYSFSALLHTSLNDTLRRLKLSSATAKDDDLVPNDKQTEIDVMARLLQTAFTSGDACEADFAERKESNEGVMLQTQVGQDSLISDVKGLVEDTDHAQVKKENSIFDPTGVVASSEFRCGASSPVDLIQKVHQPRLSSCSRTRSVRSQTDDVTEHAGKTKPCLLNDEQSEVAETAEIPTAGTVKSENVRRERLPPAEWPTFPYENTSDKHEKVPGPSIGFSFPSNNNAFRQRVSAVSYAAKENIPGVREKRAPSLGHEEMVNKEIYENSKPLPLLTERDEILGTERSSDVKTSRTTPSSPVCKFPIIRKTSLSMSDLQDALINVAAERNGDSQGNEIHEKNLKKSPLRKERVLNNADAPKAKVKYSNKVYPTKLPKLRDTRCPTGFPFNSMLSDTIRRNFRERASPVAIFALNNYQAQHVSGDTIVASSPSIDEWTTVVLQPGPTLALSRSHERKAGGITKRQMASEAVGRIDPTRFVPLPVLLYPSPDAAKPRPHGSAKRNLRHHTVTRRRSLSSLHYSVLSKRMRQRQRSAVEPTGPLAQLPPSGLKVSINRTYPAYRIASAGHATKTSEIGQIVESRAPSTEKSRTLEDPAPEDKTLFEGATTAPESKRNDRESSAERIADESKDVLGAINELYSKTAFDGDARETQTDTSSSGGKKNKSSFLRRFIKGKKKSKNDLSMDRSSLNGCGEASSRAEGNLIHLGGVKKKPSRQERLRANFLEKKKRFLGKDSKPRKRATASTDARNVSDNLTSNSHESLPTVGDGASKSNLWSKGDKTVKNALYKPTLVCMAAIEGPKKDQGMNEPSTSSIPEKPINGNARPDVTNEERDSLPTAIRQRGDVKSVAGTPGVRINSETGDILEASEARSLTTLLSSTKILENDNTAE